MAFFDSWICRLGRCSQTSAIGRPSTHEIKTFIGSMPRLGCPSTQTHICLLNFGALEYLRRFELHFVLVFQLGSIFGYGL